MNTPKPLRNQARAMHRSAQRSALVELNKEIQRRADEMRRQFEQTHGVRLVRIHQGPMFAQPAFENAGKLPDALLTLLLAGRGTDPTLKTAERHALLLPSALREIGAPPDEEVSAGIWNKQLHKEKAARMRELIKSHGYTCETPDRTLGHFLKRIQAGRTPVATEDSNAPRWIDGKTLAFSGELIRVTWRGDYPQDNRTKASAWRLLGEYAKTRAQQKQLVEQARAVQAELEAKARQADTQAAELAALDESGLFETADTGLARDCD